MHLRKNNETKKKNFCVDKHFFEDLFIYERTEPLNTLFIIFIEDNFNLICQ